MKIDEIDKCDDNIAVRCKDCKFIIYIAVNHPAVMDSEEKKEVAEMLCMGHHVEHMTRQQFKDETGAFGCQCIKAKAIDSVQSCSICGEKLKGDMGLGETLCGLCSDDKLNSK